MSKQTRFQPLEPLVPERFREARRSRGLSMEELAAKLGVTRQAISKYELGQAVPSFSVLDGISKQLDIPISFFSKPITTPENRGTVFYRSLKRNAACAKEIMDVKSEWAIQIAKVLEKDIVFPAVDFPSIPEELYKAPTYDFDTIEDIAMCVRKHWELGTLPIQNMSRLLESHGFVIATIKTGFTETDACSSFVGVRPFIFLDMQKECAVRTRFNLAHELGHLILHGDLSQTDILDPNVLKRIEREANQFASAFLLPRDAFLFDIRSTALQSFIPLKEKWKVSIQAMVYRCNDLNVFSENQMIYIRKQISAKRWRKVEPFDTEWPCEDSAILRTAIKMLIDRGDYTKEEFLSLFRLNPKDVEELCSLPSGYFSQIATSNTIVIDFASRRKRQDNI